MPDGGPRILLCTGGSRRGRRAAARTGAALSGGQAVWLAASDTGVTVAPRSRTRSCSSPVTARRLAAAGVGIRFVAVRISTSRPPGGPLRYDRRAQVRRVGEVDVSASGGTKAIIAALLANAGIALAKFVGFLITGSSSMLAEAVHSVADTGNQGLLLLGGKRAQRAATAEHPFGYGRDRYFYSFVVALVLFTLGSVFALYEGIHKLEQPRAADLAAGRGHHPGGRRSAWRASRSAPRSTESRPAQGPTRPGGSSSASPRRPSCRWCCWRTSAR